MTINNHSLLASPVAQADRSIASGTTKFYISIMMAITLLLLMANNALSAVIDDIQADMQLNEAPLLNAPIGPFWTKGAAVEMGGAPRGDATPYWWKPSNLTYKSSTPWTTIAPWFVIYPGVSNAAKNVRVKVSGLKAYVLKKSTNEWVKLNTGTGKPLWAANYGFNLTSYVSNAPARAEPDGQLSYKLNADSNPLHGGLPRFELSPYIDPMDVGSVIVSIKSELILDNPYGVDDRALAQILFNVGADYYPTMTTKIADFSPMAYVPSVGGSRYGLVKTTPRMHYMATIDPPGTSKNVSEYTLKGGSTAIPITQLVDNMPPEISLDAKLIE